jgi:hypothetical protein
MTLTQEEKEKIEEEERVRANARVEYAEKNKSHFWRNIGIVIIGFFIFVIVSSAVSDSGSSSSKSSSKDISLNADVKVNNLIVEVTNKDTFNWTDCELIVNYDSDYFRINIDSIPTDKPLTYRLNDFVELGTTKRFDPYAEVMRNFVIDCNTPHGKGMWSSK